MHQKIRFFVLLGIFNLSSITLAEIKLPAIFGDHMVLQQKSSVPVWGWADPGEKVSVKGDWQWGKKTTKADENGKWTVKVRTPKAGKNVSLTIKGKDNEIVLNDVLIGEVWICSGQSNMAFPMGKTVRSETDIQQADIPQIRLFKFNKAYSATPNDNVNGAWHVCFPEAVKDFSAVSYYFGKNLHDKLDIPIGLISSSWGGTPAEAWTSRETIESFDCFHDALEMIDTPGDSESQQYRQQVAAWEKSINDIDPGFQDGWYKSDFYDTLWEAMEQPAEWKGTELDAYDGIVWFRQFTNLPPSWAKRDLELYLGSIDDVGTVWFNGVKVGTSLTERVYTIPASITHEGKNSIAVRIINTGSNGGFMGKTEDMRIGPVGANVDICATVSGNWKYKAALAKRLSGPPARPKNVGPKTPTALYNAMIAPLIPFRIAGVIWYQGERNSFEPILYRTLFPAMIKDWRSHWNQEDFPFYYVQIAPFEYKNRYGQALREPQMMTLDAVDNVGMAVTMDIGEEKDIHPRNKHDVGDRLARWALAKTYDKKGIVYSGPIYKSMAVEDGKIRVSFDYVDGGLTAKDGGLTDFEIAGADQTFVPAKAVIDGETIIVSSDEVKEPIAVRYGWSNWVAGSLFNKAGLPASSFRSDDWPLM